MILDFGFKELRVRNLISTPSYLFPIPYSLFPIPYSLFPIPYSLFPIPYSLFIISQQVPYQHTKRLLDLFAIDNQTMLDVL